MWHGAYSNMKQRGKDKLDGKDMADTYGVPFAIAPLCGGKASPTENDKDYPTSESTVVFHQLYPNPGFEDDVYVRFQWVTALNLFCLGLHLILFL
jgi:hypothetical protein